MTHERLRSAVAAGALAGEELHRALLQSIVEAARAIFGARAASVFLLDEETDELVFEAVAGEGEGALVGRRFPRTGIAGSVLVTGQPLVVEDVETDPRFAREAAESTGYVPKGLMAVPLVHEDRVFGVLEVLDRPQQSAFSLAELDLLARFAAQAALALELLVRARRAQNALAGAGDEASEVARLAAALERLGADRREGAGRLLTALTELLEER